MGRRRRLLTSILKQSLEEEEKKIVFHIINAKGIKEQQGNISEFIWKYQNLR